MITIFIFMLDALQERKKNFRGAISQGKTMLPRKKKSHKFFDPA